MKWIIFTFPPNLKINFKIEIYNTFYYAFQGKNTANKFKNIEKNKTKNLFYSLRFRDKSEAVYLFIFNVRKTPL
jgi:hypothetical protein